MIVWSNASSVVELNLVCLFRTGLIAKFEPAKIRFSASNRILQGRVVDFNS
jgi:hypothetical protein